MCKYTWTVQTTREYHKPNNESDKAGIVVLLGVVEVGFGIIATSATTFRPLFRKFFEGDSIIDSRVAAHRQSKEMARILQSNKRVIQDPDAISVNLSMRAQNDSSMEMKQANRNSIVITKDSYCSSENHRDDAHQLQDIREISKEAQRGGNPCNKQKDASDLVWNL